MRDSVKCSVRFCRVFCERLCRVPIVRVFLLGCVAGGLLKTLQIQSQTRFNRKLVYITIVEFSILKYFSTSNTEVLKYTIIQNTQLVQKNIKIQKCS